MGRGNQRLTNAMIRVAPFGLFTGFGTLAAVEGGYIAATLLGFGALATGKRLLDREGNRRKAIQARAREGSRELGRVAARDRISAPQMKRLAGLQEGLLESWELLPEEYGPLLEEDIYTIIGEVEDAARLARRRAALRKHLEGVDRRAVTRRIEGLERDLAELEPGSALRGPFENALAGRRGELEGYEEALSGISMVNAQLEGVESLLGNLRSELLALDTSLAPRSLESRLVHLKERVAYFRRSMDEVTRNVDHLSKPDTVTEELSAK
ncbi:MAG: hypothetical protein WA990_08230 [Rubrobacteraceae bacterium]